MGWLCKFQNGADGVRLVRPQKNKRLPYEEQNRTFVLIVSYSVKLSADGFVCSVLASSRLSASPLPSFCRCPSALGGCPRVFSLSQAILADFHAFGGLLTVCAFQILRFVPLGGLSCPRLLFVPFCPVSVAVGAWFVVGRCPLIGDGFSHWFYSLCALSNVG